MRTSVKRSVGHFESNPLFLSHSLTAVLAPPRAPPLLQFFRLKKIQAKKKKMRDEKAAIKEAKGIADAAERAGELDGTGKESHLVDSKDPDVLF